jgi:hypothetical protein
VQRLMACAKAPRRASPWERAGAPATVTCQRTDDDRRQGSTPRYFAVGLAPRGCEIVKVYKDHGISGAKGALALVAPVACRPGFTLCGDACAVERAADALHCARIDAKPSGDLAYALSAPRGL